MRFIGLSIGLTTHRETTILLIVIFDYPGNVYFRESEKIMLSELVHDEQKQVMVSKSKLKRRWYLLPRDYGHDWTRNDHHEL